jgi:hypothetical protein
LHLLSETVEQWLPMALLISSYRTTRSWGLCVFIFFSRIFLDMESSPSGRQDEVAEIQDVGSLIVQTDEIAIQ